MTVLVRYHVLFWLRAGRTREERIDLPQDSRVSDLFRALLARHGPGFREQLVDGDRLHPLCWCLVNERRLAPTELDLELRDGDEVVLTTPLVVGG